MKFILFPKNKPKDGENVLWVWNRAGQITAGDFYKGECRDAANNYQIINKLALPSHFIKWPKNWP